MSGTDRGCPLRPTTRGPAGRRLDWLDLVRSPSRRDRTTFSGSAGHRVSAVWDLRRIHRGAVSEPESIEELSENIDECVFVVELAQDAGRAGGDPARSSSWSR